MDDPLPVDLVENWQSFLFNENGEKNSHVLSDLFKHPLLFPLQRRREMEKMHSIARVLFSPGPRVVMEIGADKGGSVWAWCNQLPSIKCMIACEIRGTPYSRLFEKAFPHISFLWLPFSSYEMSTVAIVRNWLLKQDKLEIDTLFIDGDKSWFELDFDCYQSFMTPGGVVFTHDVQDTAPREAYQRIADREAYRCHTVVDISEAIESVQKGIKGYPPESCHDGWLRYWGGRSCGVGVINIPK